MKSKRRALRLKCSKKNDASEEKNVDPEGGNNWISALRQCSAPNSWHCRYRSPRKVSVALCRHLSLDTFSMNARKYIFIVHRMFVFQLLWRQYMGSKNGGARKWWHFKHEETVRRFFVGTRVLNVCFMNTCQDDCPHGPFRSNFWYSNCTSNIVFRCKICTAFLLSNIAAHQKPKQFSTTYYYVLSTHLDRGGHVTHNFSLNLFQTP